MSKFGLTEFGFNSKDFTILKQELLERWEASFGEIDSAPDGFFGQLADSLGYAHTEFWDIINKIYLNINPQTATDTNLVRLLGLLGMTPLAATNASVDALCGGDAGTTLTAGSASVARATQAVNYVLDETFTLDVTEVNRYNFKIDNTLVAGSPVSVEHFANVSGGIQDTAYTEITTGSNPYEIAAQYLVNAINNKSVTLDISEAIIDPDDPEAIIVTTYSPYRTIRVVSVVGGTLTKIWKTASFTANETGVFTSPPLTVTQITGGSVAGWTDVVNLVSGRAGSDAENDNDLRRRFNLYKQVGSTGSRNSIESKIWQNVKGVANVIINENTSDYTDTYGRPPHSIHCIVDGGDEDQIATILAENIPAGIVSFGSVSKNVDVGWQTDPFIVNFDKINSIFGWVKITVQSLNPEENLPVNAKELIKQQVYNDALKDNVLGGDIISQKFVGSIYRAVQGIQVVSVETAVTGRPETSPDVKVGEAWNYDPTTYSSGWEPVKVVVAPYDRVEWRDGFNRIIVEGV